MTTMIAEIYDALREAGASEQRSRAAAETLASYDDRFSAMDRRFDSIDGRLDGIDHKLEASKAELKADLRLLHWMFGLLVAGTATLILKAFFPGH